MARRGDEALLREAMERFDQGVTIFDRDLKLVSWNAAFLDLCRFPAALAREGADFADFIRYNAERGEYGEGDPEAIVREVVAKALRFESHEFERRRPDDGRIIRVSGGPLPSGGFVTLFTDVTARRAFEAEMEARVAERAEALALSEKRLDLIANEVPAGIAHLDTGMRFLYANTRFARAYRMDPAQLIGRSAAEVLHPRTLADSTRFFEQVRRGATVDFEMNLRLPDGSSRAVRTLLRPEKPSQGEVIGFYLLSIDVTRQKETHAALMRSQKMDALGRMASGISHDFNNLLTILIGNLAPLAERLEADAESLALLSPALAAARRGSDLTRRLLSLARREPIDPQPVRIHEAAEELLRIVGASFPKAMRVGLSAADKDLHALVDRAQLEMALLNLALNARDATGGRGRMEIAIAPRRLDEEEGERRKLPAGDYVEIAISDDGCGMEPEQAERVFEPFYSSKAGAGTGLGLSMVYGFVRQSNGAVLVETAPGLGACFRLLLPACAAAAAAEEPARPAPVPADDPARRPLVLLVEDDPGVQRIVGRRLAKLSTPFLVAGDAEEALQILGAVSEVSLMLTDVAMPGGMDGIALARHVRARFPQVDVALMSGHRSIEIGDDLRGATFLRKPFEPEELDALLGRHGARMAGDGRRAAR